MTATSPAALLAPRDITIPEPGSRTARDILSRALGRLVVDARNLPRNLAVTRSEQADVAAVAALAGRLSKSGDAQDAAALTSCLRSPTVAALLRTVRNEGAKPNPDRGYARPVLHELCAALCFELSLAGVIDSPVRLNHLPSRILSLSARASIRIPDGATGAVFTKERVVFEVPGRDVELDPAAVAAGEPAGVVVVTRPYHPVARDLSLSTEDDNPRAAFGANPGEPPNLVDLGGRPPAEWNATLREGIALIEQHCPTLHGEFDLYVRQIVPTGFHPETHRSASYRESIGAIYTSLHPLLMTMTEALVHELSHNKLHALFELDPVIENPAAARYRSPVRTDPRPLRGVLLAVHAFLPIAHLYEKMLEQRHPLSRSPYFSERFAQIRRLNREGAAVVLDNARPTPVGRAVLDEIRKWIDHFAG